MIYPAALNQPLPAWAAHGTPSEVNGPFILERHLSGGKRDRILAAFLRRNDPLDDGTLGWTWEDTQRVHYFGPMDWSTDGDQLTAVQETGERVVLMPVTRDLLREVGVPVADDQSPIVAAWDQFKPWWIADEPTPTHDGYTPQPNTTMPRNWP